MPVEYIEFIFDYRIDGSIIDWLKSKDDDGWEFVTFCPKDFSGVAWNHIVQCIFRRKV